MANQDSRGFLRDTDTGALIVVGLDLTEYRPLESFDIWDVDDLLYRRGVPV